MALASNICSSPNCPNLQPCPDHTRLPWQSSNRRQLLTSRSGSREQKRSKFVIRRDKTICHVCHYPLATEADHIIPLAEGGSDTVDNMAAIHVACHKVKTQAESKRARDRRNQ